MQEIMRVVCTDFETELVEFNGEGQHVHLLVNYPPEVALSKHVNTIKGVSSCRMRQEFPDIARHYYQTNKRWSGSEFAGHLGGAPLTAYNSTSSNKKARFRALSGVAGPPAGPSPPP